MDRLPIEQAIDESPKTTETVPNTQELSQPSTRIVITLNWYEDLGV